MKVIAVDINDDSIVTLYTKVDNRVVLEEYISLNDDGLVNRTHSVLMRMKGLWTNITTNQPIPDQVDLILTLPPVELIENVISCTDKWDVTYASDNLLESICVLTVLGGSETVYAQSFVGLLGADMLPIWTIDLLTAPVNNRLSQVERALFSIIELQHTILTLGPPQDIVKVDLSHDGVGQYAPLIGKQCVEFSSHYFDPDQSDYGQEEEDLVTTVNHPTGGDLDDQDTSPGFQFLDQTQYEPMPSMPAGCHLMDHIR